MFVNPDPLQQRKQMLISRLARGGRRGGRGGGSGFHPLGALGNFGGGRQFGALSPGQFGHGGGFGPPAALPPQAQGQGDPGGGQYQYDTGPANFGPQFTPGGMPPFNPFNPTPFNPFLLSQYGQR